MNYNSNNRNVIINVTMREMMIIIMTVTMMYDDEINKNINNSEKLLLLK